MCVGDGVIGWKSHGQNGLQGWCVSLMAQAEWYGGGVGCKFHGKGTARVVYVVVLVFL